MVNLYNIAWNTTCHHSPSIIMDSQNRLIISYLRRRIGVPNKRVWYLFKDFNAAEWVSAPGPDISDQYLDCSLAKSGTDLYIAMGSLGGFLIWKGIRSGKQYSWSQQLDMPTNNPDMSPFPVIVDNSDVVIWSDFDAIYYMLRNGVNWSEPELIAYSPYTPSYSQVCLGKRGINQLLHVFWTEKNEESLTYWLNSSTVKLPIWCVPTDNATRPNNGELLNIDAVTGNIHTVFNTGSTIAYLKTTDKGETWEDVIEVDSGVNPSIALDSAGLPRISYLKNDTVFCQILKPDSTRDTVVIFGSDEYWKPNQPAVAPSYPPELADYSYCTFSANDLAHTTISKVNFSVFDVKLHTTSPPNEVAIGESLISPSIAITPGDYAHIVWEQKGEIYYRTSLQPIVPAQPIIRSNIYNVSESPTVISEHPVIEAYGENVIVAWKEGVTGEIFRRIRKLSNPGIVWLPIENISQSPNQESDYPVLSTSDVVTWQEKVDSLNYEIYAWIKGDIVNLSETENSSKYPHIAVEPQGFDGDSLNPKIVVDAIWTEAVIPDSLHEVRFKRYEHAQGDNGSSGKIEYISVSIGDSLPSPYCQQRDGYFQYGEYKIDYSRSSLLYNLPYLKPKASYLIRALVYQGERDRWREKMYIDDTLVADVYYDPEILRMVNIVLPKGKYGNDLAIRKEIRKVLGRVAVVADMKVYEVNLPDSVSGKEGAFGNREDLKIFALYQNHPNPFKDLTKIAFALPRECKVSLFVYNVTGRRVRTLIDEKMKPGNYKLKWDGKDNHNRKLAQGIYFYRLQTEDFKDTKKSILLK